MNPVNSNQNRLSLSNVKEEAPYIQPYYRHYKQMGFKLHYSCNGNTNIIKHSFRRIGHSDKKYAGLFKLLIIFI